MDYNIRYRKQVVFTVRGGDGVLRDFESLVEAQAFVRAEQAVDKRIEQERAERKARQFDGRHREDYFAILQREMDRRGLEWSRGDCYLITRDNFPEIASHFGYTAKKME